MPVRGVRYYQTVPPPEEEWEPDYATMAASGIRLVVLPIIAALSDEGGGRFDFSPLLRQLELARRHGLRVAVAPEVGPEASAAEAALFLRALASALAPFPALEAYDLASCAAQGESRAASAHRIEVLRNADPQHAVIVPASWQTDDLVDRAAAAGELLPHEATDQARAFARGRRLWVTGLRAHSVAQVRRQAWSGLASGAHALVYEAWRPELRAGVAASPGLARPDGSPSARLEAAIRLDELLARHPALAAARPVAAEAAVVVVPESEEFWAASGEGRDCYRDALLGAYRALGLRGAQVELAPPDALGAYPLAYVPMAPAVSAATADVLRRYVAAGGHLVAEACLARFDERGQSARETPRHGLAEVFGARALDAPERLEGEPRPTFAGRRGHYPCFGTREPLEATSGRVKSPFADGSAAIVDHVCGAGATRLIGTHVALGFQRTGERSYAQVVLDSLAFAGARPRVLTTSPEARVRLLKGDGDGWFLCAFNRADAPQEARLRMSRQLGRFRHAFDLRAAKHLRLLNNSLRLKLPPADGLVLLLEPAPPRRPWRRARPLVAP